MGAARNALDAASNCVALRRTTWTLWPVLSQSSTELGRAMMHSRD